MEQNGHEKETIWKKYQYIKKLGGKIYYKYPIKNMPLKRFLKKVMKKSPPKSNFCGQKSQTQTSVTVRLFKVKVQSPTNCI